MIKYIPLTILFLGLSTSPLMASCPSTPWGEPSIQSTTNICHQGYYTAYDSENKIPGFVSWVLTEKAAQGCNGRDGQFSRDPMANGKDVSPSTYDNSGYDRGHLADANDFNYDHNLEVQSFYMTNMTPQVPGLNRGPWKWVEEASRNWAVDEHQVTIYAGPVISRDDKRFNGVDVPKFFWKIIIDSTNNDSITFLMPNKKFSSKAVPETIVSINDIQNITGIKFPLPKTIDVNKKANMDDWPVDFKDFHDKKSSVCTIK